MKIVNLKSPIQARQQVALSGMGPMTRLNNRDNSKKPLMLGVMEARQNKKRKIP